MSIGPARRGGSEIHSDECGHGSERCWEGMSFPTLMIL